MNLALALAPLFAALTPLPLEPAPQDVASLFAAAKAPLTIAWSEGEDVPTLLDLLTDYAELTGQSVSYSQETAQYLLNARVQLTAPVTVPASEVQHFVESLLVGSDFVLGIDRTTEPRLLSVHSLQTAQRNTIRSRTLHLPLAELEWMRQHPAVLVTTSLNLPNTDVRQVSNSMRTMITDANTQQMLPAGNMNTMVLTGFGTSVASLVDLLQLIDSASVPPARPEPVLEVIPLRHVAAEELAPIVESALAAVELMRTPPSATEPAQSAGRIAARVVAEPRTNALIVACWPNDLERVKRLVADLDIEVK